MGEPWKTSITKVEPNKLLVRGYKLDELIGKLSFAEMVYLLIKGELPSVNVGKMMNAILVSSVDHGVTPPSVLSTLTAASTGAPVNAALAAGILSINNFHGGAIEECMNTIYSIKNNMKERSLSAVQGAEEMILVVKGQKKMLSGFGHRIHTDDPRTKKLLKLAEELNIKGIHIDIALALESSISKDKGKKLPLNVDGAIAAILCELGFDSIIANAFFIMARLPGLLSHYLEEITTQKRMRVIDPNNWEYNGPEERNLDR